MTRGALLVCSFALTLAAACDRGRPAPASAPTAPAPAPTPTAPAPSPTPAPAAVCTATTANSFHLRPIATSESTGPEYPAGTRLAVLTVDDGATRRSTQMYAVRVLSDGATGHAYLSARELSADCPAPLRDPAERMACQSRCAAPHQSEHDRCLDECTRSGQPGSECLDACQVDGFVACMRAQCEVEDAPRLW